MTYRHLAREFALQILYQNDLLALKIDSSNLPRSLHTHFEHFKVKEDLREFVSQLVVGTLLNQESIDAMIEKQSNHWRMKRMPLVDRCVLRMAAYELLILKETERAIVIDEAIELAKTFGSKESSAFVHGVLDQLKLT